MLSKKESLEGAKYLKKIRSTSRKLKNKNKIKKIWEMKRVEIEWLENFFSCNFYNFSN